MLGGDLSVRTRDHHGADFIHPLFIPVPAILFAGIWFGLQVLQGAWEIAGPPIAADVAWWAHTGGFAFGALFAVLARLLMHGTQTPITRWSDMHDRRPWRRHVPIVKPREWRKW